MKIIFSLLGLLVFLAGLLPLLKELSINLDFLSFIPLTGTTYNIIILILGLLVVYFSVKRKKKKKNE